MNRREFTKAVAIGAASLGLVRAQGRPGFAPQFSITMDDFAWHNAVYLTAEKRNQAILNTLSANKAKAVLFVVGSYVEDEPGKALLRYWDSASHTIGNHTYSHRSLNSD